MMEVVTRRVTAGFLLFAAMLSLWTGPAAAAGIFRVDAASTAAAPDGSAWGSAYKTLQKGAEAANAAGGGELWVKAAVYTETGYRVLSVGAGVSVYGGFSGFETAREQRNWVANATIIDGENRRQCVYFSGSGAFDGFVVTRGKSSDGGGIYVGYSAAPMIAHCAFINNSAQRGGGMCSNGKPTVTNCVFKQNRATELYSNDGGGAIYTSDYTTSTTFRNCTFSANSATRGGCIYNSSGRPLVTGCILWGNAASSGPEIFNYNSSNLVSANYSCVQGGYTGPGNINLDPLFVDATGQGSLQLKAGSPCLDAAGAAGAPLTELLGRSRPQGAGYDMGAYEGAVVATGIVQITVNVSPAGSGRSTPEAGHRYHYGPGEPILLSVEPLGRRFVRWLAGALVSNSPTVTFVLHSSTTATAEFTDNIIRVNAAQTGPADGTGWETAYRTLWEGVEAAGAGGEVWVAKGSYTAAAGPVLTMKSGVNLYGGFSGFETAREQRNPEAAHSVIDGENQRRCVVGADDAVLDGFEIRRGFANSGAGMYNRRTAPTVAGCAFTANRATVSGGGMLNEDCSPAITNCTFSQNSAVTGGGAHNDGSSPTLTNCSFSGNRAAYGGALYNYTCQPTLVNCVLWGDSAPSGPEIFNSESATTVDHSCVQGGYAGAGNLSTDPLFVGDNGGSLQLRQHSPCVDAGTAASAPGTDGFGRPRPLGAGVDMGAFEGVVADSDIVALTVNIAPEYGGSTSPPPGTHYRVRGETVPLYSQALGHRFTGWTGDVTAPTPQTAVLMDSDKTATAEFAENIVRVNAASTAENPAGDSWDSAYRTLQDGMDAAAAAGGGTVWAAAGTYTATTSTVLAMRPGTFVYGGFAGNETAPAGRDFTANRSVIDGENARRCVYGATGVLLDGFTVTRGFAYQGNGAGMYNSNASLTVSNCVFADNTAAYSGGAMASADSTLTISDCTFTRNTTQDEDYSSFFGGGAVSNAISAATIARCEFADNSTVSDGGAICSYYSTLDAENCVFRRNSAAGRGGALLNYLSSGGTVTNCTFSANSAGESGGAIDDYSGMTRITNSIFWNDRAFGGFPEIYFPGFGSSPGMVSHSCVQGGLEGAGNISAEPLFVGDEGGSVRLRPGSPCVDTGTADGAPNTDLLGRARPEGAGVDMGAYEGTVSAGDTVTLTIAVTPENAGRTMPAAGVHYFARGETAMINAAPVGYQFTGWAGDVSASTPTATLVMDSDRTVTAQFAPRVAHVNAGQTSPGDGSSWGSSFNSLQAAVDAVAAAGGGELWVAAGTYTATTNPVLTMKPGVFLFGGFSGTESSREQRDWNANATTIDGEGKRRCVTGADDALLDGFVITKGGTGYSSDGGAGMYNDKVSPTVAHCVFSENAAARGAGMYNRESSCLVSDCVFRQNGMTSDSGNYEDLLGGGMYNDCGAPSITGCQFEGNMATVGGAICNWTSAPVISRCVFTANLTQRAGYSYQFGGGAAICNIQASPAITACLFKENMDESNSSSDGGGAILNRWAPYSSTLSSPVPTVILVENCVFLENTTTTHGNAICNIHNPLKVVNCTFAENGSARSEAIYNDSRAYSTPPDVMQPTISNSIVRGAADSSWAQITEAPYSSPSASTLLVNHSCVQGGYSGPGNIDADPLFAGSQYGDVRLLPNSPCIDTGTPDGAPDVDFLEVPRPQGAGFDMGAYERDGTPPDTPVVTGPGSPANNSRPTFEWASGGNAGAGLYRFGFAEGLWLATDDSRTSFTPSSDLSDGRFIFYVQERDVAGNWSASGTFMFLLDTVAPNAPVVGGPASPAMNPKPTWSWTSGGGGTHLYRYGHAEDAWLATDNAEPAFTPQENLSDGGHALYVQERDEAGNWSASGVFSVVVDATPPSAPVVAGAPSPTSNALPAWTWLPGGGDGIGQYRFGFDESAWLAVAVTATGFTAAAPLNDGVHVLFVQERDAAGNWSVSGSFAVTVDTTPPGVPVVSGAVVPANSARPTWTWLSGGNGVGLFRFGYADGAWTAADVPTVTFTPEANLADGSHTLFVQERDGAGNWSASGSSAVVVNTVVYHRVTVETTTGGTVTLDPAQPEGGYPGGTVVTVTATADGDYAFTNWTGALGGNTTPTTLVVDADKTVGAVFTATPAEGEGEAPPPVTDEEAAQRLTDNFDAADRDGSGALSAAEAMAGVPGITAEQFARLDSDGDGQVTRDELEAVLNPDAGCGCRKSALAAEGLKRRLGDLFLFGLAMATLLALRARRA